MAGIHRVIDLDHVVTSRDCQRALQELKDLGHEEVMDELTLGAILEVAEVVRDHNVQLEWLQLGPFVFAFNRFMAPLPPVVRHNPLIVRGAALRAQDFAKDVVDTALNDSLRDLFIAQRALRRCRELIATLRAWPRSLEADLQERLDSISVETIFSAEELAVTTPHDRELMELMVASRKRDVAEHEMKLIRAKADTARAGIRVIEGLIAPYANVPILDDGLPIPGLDSESED